MPARTFTIKTAEGDEQRTLDSSRFGIEINGVVKQPSVVTELEIENNGDHSTTKDQCGNTQRQRTTNEGWTLRVNGICTGNDNRAENLSMQTLRDVVAPADQVTVISDLTGGTSNEFVVSNTLLSQPSDYQSINTRDTIGDEQAFEFQLQLGEESN